MAMLTVSAIRTPTDRLLLAGALAGPVFVASVGAQMLTRDGFDITRHAISQLATGDLGWIQIATFVLAGLGALALAVGVKRSGSQGRALPVLIGIFGVGLIASGVFTTDPENGFPTGTPDGPVARMSWHSAVHATAAVVAFTALAVAAIIVTVRQVRRKAPAPAVLSGATALVLLLPMSTTYMSIQLALTGLVALTWTTALALSMRNSA